MPMNPTLWRILQSANAIAGAANKMRADRQATGEAQQEVEQDYSVKNKGDKTTIQMTLPANSVAQKMQDLGVQQPAGWSPGQLQSYREVLESRPQAPTPAAEGGGLRGALINVGKSIAAGGGLAGFDRRKGWGNLVGMTNNWLQGQAIREQNYQQSMNDYRREIRNVREQIQRNEIDLPIAKARIEEYRMKAKAAENEINAANEPFLLDSLKVGPKEKAFFEAYLLPYAKEDSRYVPISAYDSLMKGIRTPGSDFSLAWIQSKIDDYDDGIINLQQELETSGGKSKEKILQDIERIKNAKNMFVQAQIKSQNKPLDEVDKELDREEQRARIEHERAQTQKITTGMNGLGEKAKPVYKPAQALKIINKEMDSLPDPQAIENTEIAIQFIPDEMKSRQYIKLDERIFGTVTTNGGQMNLAKKMYAALLTRGLSERTILARMVNMGVSKAVGIKAMQAAE